MPTIDCPDPKGAGTTHAGFVMSDGTWTAAGSPHVVTARRPRSTCRPAGRIPATRNGAVPQLGGNDAPTRTRLIADGTSSPSPITITSGRESPLAGDRVGILWQGGPMLANVMKNIVVE